MVKPNKDSRESFILINQKLKDFSFNMTDVLVLLSASFPETSISDVQRDVGVAYKNLAPHIKKLVKYKLLEITDNGRGKRKFIRTKINEYRPASLLVGLIDFFSLDMPQREIAIQTLKKFSKKKS